MAARHRCASTGLVLVDEIGNRGMDHGGMR